MLVVGLLETAVSMRIAETSFGSFSGGMVKAWRQAAEFDFLLVTTAVRM